LDLVPLPDLPAWTSRGVAIPWDSEPSSFRSTSDIITDHINRAVRETQRDLDLSIFGRVDRRLPFLSLYGYTSTRWGRFRRRMGERLRGLRHAFCCEHHEDFE
jgi:hypothetical protein